MHTSSPTPAKLLAMSGTVDAINCCKVLIKGKTMHFKYISLAVTGGIMNVNLATVTPVVYGILNCVDEAQVRRQSSDLDGGHNHGMEWGKMAVEMAILPRDVHEGDDAGLWRRAQGGGEKTKPGFF
jgi:6,7-dimethyl-8-ribityllumazine synthase